MNVEEKKIYINLLKGDFRCLPERKSNIVRIFFSSTFTGSLGNLSI